MKSSKAMRVIVTGGAGFIGGHLCDRLVGEGHDVFAIDNLSFGRREHLPSGVDLWEVDLGTVGYEAVAEVLRKVQPDVVVHLAAIHFIPYCMEHPDEAFRTNVRGTHAILAALEGLSVRKVVFASSMDVYAAADRRHTEGDSPEPCNIYGLSKLLGEEMVEYATRTVSGLSGVSLRFANVFGPRETNPHLIPETVTRVMASDAAEIRMGYLGATRDFIHVYDLVDAIVRAAEAGGAPYGVLNVGTAVDTEVRKVVSLIQGFAGDKRPVIEDAKKFRKFDRASLSPSTERIQSVLGWQPKVSLEEGLRELVEWERTAARRDEGRGQLSRV